MLCVAPQGCVKLYTVLSFGTSGFLCFRLARAPGLLPKTVKTLRHFEFQTPDLLPSCAGGNEKRSYTHTKEHYNGPKKPPRNSPTTRQGSLGSWEHSKRTATRHTRTTKNDCDARCVRNSLDEMCQEPTARTDSHFTNLDVQMRQQFRIS